MPRLCSCFGCRGNYDGTPYVKIISFPKDPEERERWILAMPNENESLRRLKKIYICETHFNCEWVSVKGGMRPKEPPSIFPGVPKSVLKQVTSAPRPTYLHQNQELRRCRQRMRLRQDPRFRPLLCQNKLLFSWL